MSPNDKQAEESSNINSGKERWNPGATGSSGFEVMRFKTGEATARMALSVIRVTAVVYIFIPVYLIAGLLYQRRTAGVEVSALIVGGMTVVLVALTLTDVMKIRLGQFERLNANFAFLQVAVGTALVTYVNAAVSRNSMVFRPIFILPLVVAAVMGDATMVLSTWVLGLAGLTGVTWAHYHATDTTVWSAVIYGCASFTVGAVVHMSTARLLEFTESSEALAALAERAAGTDSWPSGLSGCLPDLARALQTRHVAVFFALPGAAPVLVGSWHSSTRSPRSPKLSDEMAIPTAAIAQTDGKRDLDARLEPEVDLPLLAQDANLIAAAISGSTSVTNAKSRGIVVGAKSAAGGVVVLVTGPCEAMGFELDAPAATAARIVAGIAERAALMDGLQRRAGTDALTGLPNRWALLEAFDREIARAKRTGEPLTVIMVDLDGFKAYNDRFGHVAGDEVLRQFAAHLRDSYRGHDIVSRYGGEEFCLLLPGTDAEGAAAVIERLRASAPVLDPEGKAVTFSAGVVQWHGEETMTEVVDRADHALYDAKKSGRDRVVLAVP